MVCASISDLFAIPIKLPHVRLIAYLAFEKMLSCKRFVYSYNIVYIFSGDTTPCTQPCNTLPSLSVQLCAAGFCARQLGCADDRLSHSPAAHHRVVRLCAAWWCAAGFCERRLGCVTTVLHTTETLGCVQLGGVLQGCVAISLCRWPPGIFTKIPNYMEKYWVAYVIYLASKIALCGHLC